MTNSVEIKIKDEREFKKHIKQFEGVVKESSEVIMAAIASTLHTHTLEVFETEGVAGEGKWVELKDSTKESKERRGYGSEKILRERGMDAGLMNSVISDSDDAMAQVGVAGEAEFLGHARAHQFGTSKAGKKKNVTIAARPFLVMTQEVIDKIEDEFMIKLEEKIEEATGGR